MSKQLFPCRLHGKPRLLVHLESFPTSDGGVEYQCHPLHVCTFLTKGVAEAAKIDEKKVEKKQRQVVEEEKSKKRKNESIDQSEAKKQKFEKFILLTQEEEIQRLRKEKSALLNEIKSIRKALRAGEPKKEVKEETKEEDTSNMTEQEKLILQLKKEREALQQSLTETMNIIPPKHEKKVHNVKEKTTHQLYIEELQREKEALKARLEGNSVRVNENIADPGETKVLIRNLIPTIKDEEIKKLFESIGAPLTSIKVARAGAKNECLFGTCVISYAQREQALKAVSEFNGTLFKGKRIEVSLKKRLQSPHLQDFESWNAIFTEKVKESGGCRTIVVRTEILKTEAELKQIFSHCGTIEHIGYKKGPNGENIHPAFVTFVDTDSVIKSLHMNKSEIADGSKIGIRLSTSGTYKPQVVKTNAYYAKKRHNPTAQKKKFADHFSI